MHAPTYRTFAHTHMHMHAHTCTCMQLTHPTTETHARAHTHTHAIYTQTRTHTSARMHAVDTRTHMHAVDTRTHMHTHTNARMHAINTRTHMHTHTHHTFDAAPVPSHLLTFPAARWQRSAISSAVLGCACKHTGPGTACFLRRKSHARTHTHTCAHTLRVHLHDTQQPLCTLPHSKTDFSNSDRNDICTLASGMTYAHLPQGRPPPSWS